MGASSIENSPDRAVNTSKVAENWLAKRCGNLLIKTARQGVEELRQSTGAMRRGNEAKMSSE